MQLRVESIVICEIKRLAKTLDFTTFAERKSLYTYYIANTIVTQSNWMYCGKPDNVMTILRPYLPTGTIHQSETKCISIRVQIGKWGRGEIPVP